MSLTKRDQVDCRGQAVDCRGQTHSIHWEVYTVSFQNITRRDRKMYIRRQYSNRWRLQTLYHHSVEWGMCLADLRQPLRILLLPIHVLIQLPNLRLSADHGVVFERLHDCLTVTENRSNLICTEMQQHRQEFRSCKACSAYINCFTALFVARYIYVLRFLGICTF